MARTYNDDLREAATRALADAKGFVFEGAGRLIDEAPRNPRVQEWLNEVDSILAVVFPRKARRG